MFKTRLASGIVLLVGIFATVYKGSGILLIFLSIISLIGQYELYRVVKLEKSILAYVSYAAWGGYYFLLAGGYVQYMMIASMMYMLILLSCYVLYYPEYIAEQMTMVLFGFFYVPVLLSYIYLVRIMPSGFYTVWLVFIAAWGSDTFAYCTGMLIGKHKLPSLLSPKKTIEGCIGGVVGAALLGLVYATIFKNELDMITNPQLVYMVIGAVGSVISQLGDLCASAIKRNYKIKDYGKLIPGHGGILDRFDSILFTAPVVYLFMLVFAY